jgi:hypothetical protein
MSLKEKIETYKAGFKNRVPAEKRAIMQRATEDLKNSPQMLTTVKVGDIAPDFTLKNFKDTEISLNDFIDKGPVVLIFYRGRW